MRNTQLKRYVFVMAYVPYNESTSFAHAFVSATDDDHAYDLGWKEWQKMKPSLIEQHGSIQLLNDYVINLDEREEGEL